MKKANFLKLGAFTVLLGMGLSLQNAHAQINNEDLDSKIINGIHELIKEQQKKGFLKEVSDVKVVIAKPKIINMGDREQEFPATLDANAAHIIKNSCKIAVSYFQDGSGLKLGGNSELLEVAELQNETQKKMAREFFALHEGFHCELANVENPIMVAGASKEFNDKINYYIKDIQSVSDGEGKASYFGTLSENFGDIGATGVLLRKYGKENPDLQFVLNSIQIRRHADYFSVENNNHFTHLGMENVLDNNAIKRLIEAKDAQEYNNVALEIANKSVQQLITQRKDIAEHMFSNDKLTSSVVFHLTHQILNNSANPHQNQNLMELFRKEGTENGFAKDIANDFFQGEERNLERFKNVSSDRQKDMDKLTKYVANLYAQKAEDIFSKRDIKEFDDYISKFKDDIFKQNEMKTNDFDNISKKDTVDRMMGLREKFLNTKKSNVLTMK